MISSLLIRIASWLVGRPVIADYRGFVGGRDPMPPGLEPVPFDAARAEPHCLCEVCACVRRNHERWLAAGWTWTGEMWRRKDDD